MERRMSFLQSGFYQRSLTFFYLAGILLAAIESVRELGTIPIQMAFCLYTLLAIGVLWIGSVQLQNQALAVVGIFLLTLAVGNACFAAGFGLEILLTGLGFLILMLALREQRIAEILVGLLVAALFLVWFLGQQPKLWYAVTVLVLACWQISARLRKPEGMTLLPVFLIYGLLLFAIPKPQAPIDWSFLVRLSQDIASLGDRLFGEATYYLEAHGIMPLWENGYSSLAVLGAPNRRGEREELYLTSKSTIGSLYLEGAVYDTLSDHTWTLQEEENEPVYNAWYLRFLNQMYQADFEREKVATFSKRANQSIRFGYIRTSDVLHPINLCYLDTETKRDMIGALSDFAFAKEQKKGYRYAMDFLDMDYANPYLVELLQKSRSYGEEEWASYEELSDYAKHLYNLQLVRSIRPEEAEEKWELIRSYTPPQSTLSLSGVSRQVIDLAGTLTSDCTNDFDKAMAIEAYLRTLTYGESDANAENFIDSFLFESQTGTCMHFASSMVFLLRAAGVPARLAQGYLCSYDRMDVDGTFIVSGKDAHAWPQAYIEGFGWVSFEPTPSRNNALANAWNLTLESDREIWEIGTDPGSKTPEELLAEGKAEEEKAEEENKTLLGLPVGLTIAFFLLPGLLLFLGILGLIEELLRRHRYQKKDLEGKVSDILKDIRQLIAWIEQRAELTQKPFLYAADYLAGEERETLKQIILAFYQTTYGDPSKKKEAISPASLQSALLLREELLRRFYTRDEIQEGKKKDLLEVLALHMKKRWLIRKYLVHL